METLIIIDGYNIRVTNIFYKFYKHVLPHINSSLLHETFKIIFSFNSISEINDKIYYNHIFKHTNSI